MKQRTKCTVYSRVVGFLSPVAQWNKGKQEEWKDRVPYKLEPDYQGELHGE